MPEATNNKRARDFGGPQSPKVPRRGVVQGLSARHEPQESEAEMESNGLVPP